MNYALCIIGSIIGQAVETGSTPVLQVSTGAGVSTWCCKSYSAKG